MFFPLFGLLALVGSCVEEAVLYSSGVVEEDRGAILLIVYISSLLTLVKKSFVPLEGWQHQLSSPPS